MKIKIFFFLLFTYVFSDSPIEVYLPTRDRVAPVYIYDCKDIYVKKLIEILRFDLENSGYVTVKKERGNLLNSGGFIIEMVLKKGELDIYVTSNRGRERFFSMRPSYNLSVDRRDIHKLADNFLYKFLKKRGIATRRILYSLRKRYKEGWRSEIWRCDWDGENRERLTFLDSYSVTPVSVPGGYIYVSYVDGIPKLFISDNGIKRRLISLRGNQLLPSVNMDFSALSFISDVAGRADLFLQRIRDRKPVGKPVQLFAYPRATQASSSFSPDGKKLAFVSDKDGSPRVYVIDVDFRGKKRRMARLITREQRRNVSPSWSWNGTKLAYSARTNGVRQIWIYDFLKDREEQLTFGPENKENPKWAENDMHIIYNTEDKNCSELYIVNLERPIPVKISKGIGQKRFPAWEISRFER